MEANWIWAIRCAGGKDTRERMVDLPARMHLEDVARRTMQPGENDQRVPDGDPVQGRRDRLRDLDPRVGCAFVALARGSLACREIRPDKANRVESIAGGS